MSTQECLSCGTIFPLTGNFCPDCGAKPTPATSKPAATSTSSEAATSTSSEATISCASCGEQVPAAAKFCPECGGAPVIAPTIVSSSSPAISLSRPAISLSSPICSSCGAALTAGAKFCPECGGKPASAPSSSSPYDDPSGPPCASCGKPISGRILRALDTTWHPDCFQCCQCAQSIGTDSFTVRDKKPWCDKCVEWEKKEKASGRSGTTRPVGGTPDKSQEAAYSRINQGKAFCVECQQVIQGTAVAFKDQFFHKGCLKCKGCSQALDTDKGFVSRNGAPYHPSCAPKDGSKVLSCTACGLDIVGKFVRPEENKPFHPGCFVCGSCNGPISGSFVERGGKFLCEKCATSSSTKPTVTTTTTPASTGGIRYDHKTKTTYSASAPKPTFTTPAPTSSAPTKPTTSPVTSTKPTPTPTPLTVTTGPVSAPPALDRRTSFGGSGGRITCTGCFAPMSGDLPKCPSCGKANIRKDMGAGRRVSTSGGGPPAPSWGAPISPRYTPITVATPRASVSATSPPPAAAPSPPPAAAPAASEKGAFCSECGSALPPGAKFCGECGHRP